MEMESKDDVLDKKIFTQQLIRETPHFVRRVDDKGKKYSFYDLLTKKYTSTGFSSKGDLLESVSILGVPKKTLGVFKVSNKFRLICMFIYESVAQKVITVVVISIFVLFSPFIDMNTLESRPTSLIRLSHKTILAILYLNHVWFLLRVICSSL